VEPVRVVGAALLRDGRVLASRRTEPPALAGSWEFAGGKVEPGESDEAALRREIAEELRLDVSVGDRIGPDLPIVVAARAPDLPDVVGAVLRVYLCRTRDDAEPALLDHDVHRWLGPDELDEVDWLPVDLPVVHALRELLASAR